MSVTARTATLQLGEHLVGDQQGRGLHRGSTKLALIKAHEKGAADAGQRRCRWGAPQQARLRILDGEVAALSEDSSACFCRAKQKQIAQKDQIRVVLGEVGEP